ncbi:venom allergen 3 homolog [Sabethes cyaneus]|uniref:venom allergen 3 homolog n=1 Tax=Sabethes cyaneus TaxID=53552 RepID=UPI00237E9F34|nr:venom allergen 3 homolog [Sabethes cyaneus]
MSSIISFTLVLALVKTTQQQATLCGSSSQQQTDYCSPTLCAAGLTHIACNGLTTLASTCGAGANEVTLDSSLKTLILELHNQIRSKIATGNQNYTSNGYYPQASRMATVIWSDELASIAAANARRCVYGHDQCRNTAAFKAVGQNIAMKSYYGISFSTIDLIKAFVNAWYVEYAIANATIIASYPRGYTGPAIGHFTQIVADRVTQLGCSFVTFNTPPWINQYFVCNYSITNIVGQPVYVSGNYCSRCTTGYNTRYPGLCNQNEVINSNP